MKTNQHAEYLLTSAQSQYSVKELKKNFKKRILLAFYVTVPQTLLWSRRNTSMFYLLIQKHSIPLFHFSPSDICLLKMNKGYLVQ